MKLIEEFLPTFQFTFKFSLQVKHAKFDLPLPFKNMEKILDPLVVRCAWKWKIRVEQTFV